MVTRRSAIMGIAGLAGTLCAAARASEFHSYNAQAVQRLVASGRSVVVHVYGPWCLQCHIQAYYLDGLKDDPAYSDVTFFRVDSDNQKDVVAKFGCPRSTVIASKRGREVARMSWGVTRDSVVEVLKAAI